jgi:uncharacterized membrane protein (DUF4010 family)
MEQQELINGFLKFGTSALLGFLIGLERSMRGPENPHATVRDFVIFALIGAISAFGALQYDSDWILIAGLVAVVALLLSGYWAEQQRDKDADAGITTEAAVVVTFFLGALVVHDATELAIAVTIVLLIVLSEKRVIEKFGKQIQVFELQAMLKFLVITFIVLPILPHQSLDTYMTSAIGTVTAVDTSDGDIDFEATGSQLFEPGMSLPFYIDGRGEIGLFEIDEVAGDIVSAEFKGHNIEALETITTGTELKGSTVPELIRVMLSAIKPFKVWLIVVLVSLIGFVGYVLSKVVGARAGIGLTGLIGGLASSTVTTLSFAGRSKELPQLNRVFAVAVILASAVMFPRVLFQIGVFNQELMANIALPMMVTGTTGLLLAGFLYWRSKDGTTASEEINFDNPFSLKSALTFGLVFASILIVTRVATTYLGEAWLPVVALVSGLTDADAIAFSVSDLQRAGLISLDWASFNLVLGSISNTFMKLFLVFSLGTRGLFKACLVPFVIMSAAGIITMFLYYDIGSAMG